MLTISLFLRVSVLCQVTFIRIRIQTNNSWSGQLRIQNELEVKLRYSGKLIKFDKFLNKLI